MLIENVRRGAASFMGSGSPARRLAIGSTFWALFSMGGGQALRIAANLISTRLLAPELFGLMALVTTIHVGLSLFSDVGLSVSIVRHKRGEERLFLDTAWTIQIVRGFLLWLVAIAVAPLAASFYGDDRLLWLVPLFGFNAVIQGFGSTSIHLMRRRVAVRETALLELSTQVIGLVVLLTWAWISPGVLALAAGPLASSIALLIGSHLLNRPQRDRIRWDREAVRELIGFGKWVFLSTAFTFLASQADRLLLGKLYSLHFLGVYNIGYNLADMPRALIVVVAGRVIFPMLSRAAEVPREELVSRISGPRSRILMVLAVGLAAIVACGDMLIILLYDERYAEAAWMMPILAAGVWASVLSGTVDSMLWVAGKPKVQAFAYAASFAFLVTGVLLSAEFAGELGTIIAIALSPLIHYAVVAGGLRGEKFWLWRQDLQASIVFIGVTIALLALRSAVGPYPHLLAKISGAQS